MTDSMYGFVGRLLGEGFRVEDVTPFGVVALLIKARRVRDSKEFTFIYVMVGEHRGMHRVSEEELEELISRLGLNSFSRNLHSRRW